MTLSINNLDAPLGAEVRGIDVSRALTPAEVAEIDAELTRLGKEHEFRTYDNAGHAFFAVNRPAYRVEAATDGWNRIWDFFGRYLAA